ncbi:MAG: hypothetical protein KC496_11005 [Anaerolineae bacterium]|nr:hypothetical protein [Anaerolineae bacterium]
MSRISRKCWKFVFIGLLLIIMVSVQAQENATDTMERDWRVSVWYPSSESGGGFESIVANQDLIEEVNPFWYTPAPDGHLIATAEAENEAQLAAWREARLLILPSIFASVPDIIGEPIRDVHIAAIVETVTRMDYDGIDIDYEGFPAATREDFSLFVEGLAQELQAIDKLLSVTVHAKTDDVNAWDAALAQDWQRLAAVADRFKIMTYDYTNRNEPPGPISPPDWVLDVLTYAETVTDLSKVQMGLHFYGYTWQRGTPPATATAWSGIQTYIENFDLVIERDLASQEAFIDFKIVGLPRQVVFFADPVGLAYKLEQVQAQFPNLGGVAIWGIGGEHPELWHVLREYSAE